MGRAWSGGVIEGRRVLGVIPARGGSKGVPRKNVRLVGGRPLIQWTIDAAHQSTILDRVILSCEDAEIMAVAAACGCEVPFQRPAELASDHTPAIEVVLDVIARFPEYDIVVLLQPTSPLRTASDIDGTIETMVRHDASTSVSVTEVEKSPYWMFEIDAATGRLRPLLSESTAARRQDLPPVFQLNGAVYAASVKELVAKKKFVDSGTVPYIMPRDRSLDLDSEIDFRLLELHLGEANASLSQTT